MKTLARLALALFWMFGTLGLSAAPVPRDRDGNQWGHLRGRFVIKGEVIPPERIALGRNVAVFQKYGLVDESLVVGKDGGLVHVIFFLSKVDVPVHSSYEKKKAKPTLTLQKGQFTPRILVVRTGQALEIENMSEVIFNVRSHSTANAPFNVVVPREDGCRLRFEKPESIPIPLHCDIYRWMQAYVFVSEHPYVAVTDKDGRFDLKNLPAGKYKFIAWHERLGYISPPGSKDKFFTLTIRQGEHTNLGSVPIEAKMLERRDGR